MDMRLMSTILLFLCIFCAAANAADEMKGFRGYTWGSTIEAMREDDPKLVEGHMGAMPGVKGFKRTDDDLNYGGIKADSITYTFYKGRFTSVSIDFRGFDNFEKLLAHCKKLFGPVTGAAILRQEQYASFNSPRTGAMLLYQLSMQTTNYGRLYLYSRESLEVGPETDARGAVKGAGAPAGHSGPVKPSPSKPDSLKMNDMKM